MLKTFAVAAVVAGLLLAAGCSRKPPTPTINASMTQVMSTQAQTIWDITSGAFNAKGDGLVASKIAPGDWIALGEAGRKLRDRSLLLAAAPHVVVVGPGETIMGEDASGASGKLGHDWDAASAKLVQARIDANPALFARRMRILAKTGDTVLKASQTHDVGPLYEASAGLDEVCDGCHKPFWGTDDPPPFPH